MTTETAQQNNGADAALPAKVLRLATADPRRVQREVREYDKNPEAYIQRRFTELSEWDFPVWCAMNV